MIYTLDAMSSPLSLQEFAEHLKKVLVTTSQKEFLEKTGIDKNVLYRALNSQNITLENYYKIKRHFPIATNLEVGQLPILGQILDEKEVRVLDMSQPQSVSVPSLMIDYWSPIFGYLYFSETYYHNFVAVFSTKHLDKRINRNINSRVIMVYPKGKSPVYGMGLSTKGKIQVANILSKEIQFECKEGDEDVEWARLVSFLPFSLMEYHKPTTSIEEINVTKIFEEDKAWSKKFKLSE